jgi:hypothetical protein
MRPGQPLLHVSAPSGASIESILGTNLIDYWHAADASLVSGEVQSVTGRKYGLVMSAPSSGQRPGYTANNATFGGAPTVNTARTGTRFLSTATLPNGLLPTGSRPFIWAVCRVTANAQGTLGCLISIRATVDYDVQVLQYTNSTVGLQFYDGAGRTSQTIESMGVVPHLIGAHIDAASGSSVFVDGERFAPVAAGTAATIVDTVINITLGANGVWSAPENVEAVMWGICKQAPSAAELRALYHFALAGNPPAVTLPVQPADYMTLLGSNLKALWHRGHGVVNTGNVLTRWDDRVAARQLTTNGSTASVLYEPDGSNFGGASVVKLFPNGKALISAAVSEIVPTASMPYVFCVFRWRDLAGSYGRLWHTNDNMLVRHGIASGDPKDSLTVNLPGLGAWTSIMRVGGFDTVPHLDECWLDGSRLHFGRDGVDMSIAATVTGNPINTMMLSEPNNPNGGNPSIHMLGVCAAPLTAAQRSHLRELIARDIA